MRKFITCCIACLISFSGMAQGTECDHLSFNSFEVVSGEEDYLAIKVAIKDEGDSFGGINYPGFLLRSETGDTVAYTSSEYGTYTLIGGIVYKLKIVKDILPKFSGEIEVYSGFLGDELRHKVCTKAVRFDNSTDEGTFTIDTRGDASVDNAVYLEYEGNETQGGGRIKKVNSQEWYEYGEGSSAIVGVYKETHRDGNYIYLISAGAIFQFDLSKNRIMKNGMDLLKVTTVSNKKIEIKSSLDHSIIKD